jgi:hypothetical protein
LPAVTTDANTYTSMCFATNVPFGDEKITSFTIVPLPRNSTKGVPQVHNAEPSAFLRGRGR